MKLVTRKQARAWLAPMRACFQQMHTGYLPAAEGHAVTSLNHEEYVRVDQCMAGFRALMANLFPNQPLSGLTLVESKLSGDQLITHAEIDAVMREFKEVEDLIVTVTVPDLHSAVLTTQIQIELEAVSA